VAPEPKQNPIPSIHHCSRSTGTAPELNSSTNSASSTAAGWYISSLIETPAWAVETAARVRSTIDHSARSRVDDGFTSTPSGETFHVRESAAPVNLEIR
jgi:hypothetical protein